METTRQPTSPEQKKDFVLIDDDPAFCSLMVEYAKRYSLEMDYYTSLMEMGSIGFFQKYRLAIVDYQLEQMNGLEIADYIPIFFNGMPVILISYTERSPENTLRPWPSSVKKFMHKRQGPQAIIEAAIELRDQAAQQAPDKSTRSAATTTSSAQKPGQPKGFDFSTFIDLMRESPGSTKELINKLISTFRRTSREVFMELQAALAAFKFTDIQKHAHKLNGMAANLGALKLSEMCSQLEIHSNHRNLLMCHQLITQIDRSISEANKAFEDFVTLFDAKMASGKPFSPETSASF